MSVNSYLNDLAVRAIVRDNEKNKIQVSVKAIKERLEQHFSSEVDKVFIFGSYKRGTIIPRQFDDNSDVDIMVIFGKIFGGFYRLEPRNNYPKKPQTYLQKLRDFIELRYPNSICKQSFPVVVLELNHIKFDLVPAIIDDFGDYKIPNKQGWYQTQILDWITTNPNDLDGALVNDQTLRRLVRVAKIWNVKQGRIYDSYELEKWIVQKSFYGDLSEHFYNFCNLLPINYDLSQEKKNQIQRLKDLARKAKYSDDESCIRGLFE
ncbi:MAG: nucleotidyltransferase domain-containing protein [Helicobacteraceae bacterium]|nr:nucleotidyltransferase domain-containing protein [Helicobacteraceae bacterium]